MAARLVFCRWCLGNAPEDHLPWHERLATFRRLRAAGIAEPAKLMPLCEAHAEALLRVVQNVSLAAAKQVARRVAAPRSFWQRMSDAHHKNKSENKRPPCGSKSQAETRL